MQEHPAQMSFDGSPLTRMTRPFSISTRVGHEFMRARQKELCTLVQIIGLQLRTLSRAVPTAERVRSSTAG